MPKINTEIMSAILQTVLDEYLNDYPSIRILLRDDSGFATPDLYKQCEKNGTSYVIWLKENGILREKASDLVDDLLSTALFSNDINLIYTSYLSHQTSCCKLSDHYYRLHKIVHGNNSLLFFM